MPRPSAPWTVLLVACVALAGLGRDAWAEGTTSLSAADWTTPLSELEERYTLDPGAYPRPAPPARGAPDRLRYGAAMAADERTDHATRSGPDAWVRRAMARECLCRRRASRTPRPYWYGGYLRPRSGGDWLSLGTSAAIVAGSAAMFLGGDRQVIEWVSDYGELALTTLGYAVPVAMMDGWGLAQYTAQHQVSTRITQALKNGVARWRPGLEGADSYPSAHTTGAFSGASFLHTRYGPGWGVPAYLAATVVGMTRVRLERHYLGDVVAGAGVAMVTNWLVAVPFGGECREPTRFGCLPRWRIEFDFGAVLQTRNEIEVPNTGGESIDLTDWGNDRGYPTPRFSIQYFLRPRQELMLRVDPLEVRGGETLTDDLSFAGGSFFVGDDVLIRWMAHEYKLRWRYELLPRNRRFDLRAGAALVLADYQVELFSDTSRGIAKELGLAAVPHLYAAWRPTPDLELSVTAEGLPELDFAAPEIETVLRWYVRPRWDFGIGYRLNVTSVQLPGLDNDAITHELFLAFGRSF